MKPLFVIEEAYDNVDINLEEENEGNGIWKSERRRVTKKRNYPNEDYLNYSCVLESYKEFL